MRLIKVSQREEKFLRRNRRKLILGRGNDFLAKFVRNDFLWISGDDSWVSGAAGTTTDSNFSAQLPPNSFKFNFFVNIGARKKFCLPKLNFFHRFESVSASQPLKIGAKLFFFNFLSKFQRPTFSKQLQIQFSGTLKLEKNFLFVKIRFLLSFKALFSVQFRTNFSLRHFQAWEKSSHCPFWFFLSFWRDFSTWFSPKLPQIQFFRPFKQMQCPFPPNCQKFNFAVTLKLRKTSDCQNSNSFVSSSRF